MRLHEHCTGKQTVESIYVDSSRNPKLQINFDFIIPRISCPYISLDAMDASGEQHLHIDHNIYKRRLDLDGTPIQEPKKEELAKKEVIKGTTTTTPVSVEVTTPKCGSCYGAEDANNHEKMNITCCNKCEDVREAYAKRRWHFSETKVEQCKSSASVEKIENAFKEGCQIYGTMSVNRVAGSFHVAPGQTFAVKHIHVHDIQPFSSSQFNTSHVINRLSFGDDDKGKTHENPLDGTQSITKEGATMYHYYIKIVPTKYIDLEGFVTDTNQFSVTKHEKVVSPGNSESGMPGIFFSYELSAMMVKIVEKPMHLSQLITDLCSIVGGIWIVAMFIDSICYRSSKLLNKIDLGKAS
ncbi:endoplasmic reticulum-Golgi intermediate compartment protein 3 isoform X3 [Cimex lectularius]|nr:endoplasmic reticulum-Golgi intermediate compartment protein 3 isoform X3 [Cimex lectularius]